jgi:hypothetical protein
MTSLLGGRFTIRTGVLFQIGGCECISDQIRKDIGAKILYEILMGGVYEFGVPFLGLAQIRNALINVLGVGICVGHLAKK